MAAGVSPCRRQIRVLTEKLNHYSLCWGVRTEKFRAGKDAGAPEDAG